MNLNKLSIGRNAYWLQLKKFQEEVLKLKAASLTRSANPEQVSIRANAIQNTLEWVSAAFAQTQTKMADLLEDKEELSHLIAQELDFMDQTEL